MEARLRRTKLKSSELRVMAVASGGGHWDELMLLRPALKDCNVEFVTTLRGMADRDGIPEVTLLPDANRDNPADAGKCLVAAVRLIFKHRPDVLITTGALPGLFCLLVARLLGARTVWIDSIANYEEPSLSGKVALPFSSLWLTQWPHLADGHRRIYSGALL